MLFPLLVFFLGGCHSKLNSHYREFMLSGIEKIYAEQSTREFCYCFLNGITKGQLSFETGNIFSKPINDKMLNKT